MTLTLKCRQLQKKRLRRWNLKPSIGGSTSTMRWNLFSEPSIFFGSSDWLVQGVTSKAWFSESRWGSQLIQPMVSRRGTVGLCSVSLIQGNLMSSVSWFLMTCRVLKLGVFRKSKGAQKSPAKNHRFHVSELLVVKQLKIRIMALKLFMVSFYKGVFPKMGIPKMDGL